MTFLYQATHASGMQLAPSLRSVFWAKAVVLIHGTRGISHPQPGRRLRAPPNKPSAASGPGGRWGVYNPSLTVACRSRAVRLFRPPRVACFAKVVYLE